jgi:hypothetical protein
MASRAERKWHDRNDERVQKYVNEDSIGYSKQDESLGATNVEKKGFLLARGASNGQ